MASKNSVNETLIRVLEAINDNIIPPNSLSTLLVILLKKTPFTLPKELGGFIQKDGYRNFVPEDKVIKLLNILAANLDSFCQEPIANSNYQVHLASEIVGRIKTELRQKEEQGEAKESASKINIGSYYVAIPFLKEVLRNITPHKFHHLLTHKDEFHITLKFRDFDPSIIGNLHLIKLVGVYNDNKGNSALVVSIDGKVKYDQEGGVFHITTSVAKGSKAMILGSL